MEPNGQTDAGIMGKVIKHASHKTLISLNPSGNGMEEKE